MSLYFSLRLKKERKKNDSGLRQVDAFFGRQSNNDTSRDGFESRIHRGGGYKAGVRYIYRETWTIIYIFDILIYFIAGEGTYLRIYLSMLSAGVT